MSYKCVLGSIAGLSGRMPPKKGEKETLPDGVPANWSAWRLSRDEQDRRESSSIITSESAKFKPSRASQSRKYHWRLHRSVLASNRGAPPPATSYCFFKFNRGKYGTQCKNWKVNRIMLAA